MALLVHKQEHVFFCHKQRTTPTVEITNHIEYNTRCYFINSLRADPTKWSKTLKQFVGNLPTNCLSVFDHFVGLALKGLKTRMLKTSK